MILEGNREVLSALKKKKQLLDDGQPSDHIKILCIVDGGLMKGAYSTGAGLAMEELGYSNVFDSIVGVSSGAFTSAYFVASQIRIGKSLMYEEGCTGDFLKLSRFWSPLNVQKLISAFIAGPKKIDWEKIKHSRTKLHVGVTDYETAQPKLIEINTYEDLVLSVEASSSIPTLTDNQVWIREKLYTDGGFANPHMLKHALDTIEATHVLVLTSQDKAVEDISKIEKFLNHTFLRHRYSKPLLKSADNRRLARHKIVADILNSSQEKPILFAWGDDSVSSIERDPNVVRSAIERMKERWLELLKD